MPKKKIMCPPEGVEQATLFSWASMRIGKYPDLKWMHHIPNGGKRGKAEAARLKAEGVKPGVADIFLPAPKGRYHGLYIELKTLDGGTRSKEQKEFIKDMSAAGYYATFCEGWQQAADLIEKYLEEKI